MDIFHQEQNAANEAAAATPLPKPVGSDWSPVDEQAARRDLAKAKHAERRSSIEAARAKVEAKYQTKAERLAKESPGTRDVASPAERKALRGSIEKAMEKTGYQAQDGERVPDREASNAGREEMRKAIEALQRRYPGRKASEFVKIARDWEEGFKKDPVAMREKLLETYATVSPENFRDAPKEEKQNGPSKPRDSVRRAMQDHANATDLAEWEKEFQGKLPGVLSELVKHDAALVNDPSGASARLAAAYGAPVTPRQVEQQAARQQAEHARQQDSANVHRALDLIVQHNVLPGMDDEKTLGELADILESKDFRRSGDRLADLKEAHRQVLSRRANSTKHAAGSKSIAGAPSLRLPPEKHRASVRGAIERAKR